MHIPGEEAVV
ncbi:uncharacterized protein FFE2_16061 [Fusarium fujikuroi]|nr:uncharacterized protein FFE2_16061 [Fusarium fujikuroi]SCO26131.1 uncharacterized protein FFC1_15881 [Fusarium fujikuroi]